MSEVERVVVFHDHGRTVYSNKDTETPIDKGKPDKALADVGIIIYGRDEAEQKDHIASLIEKNTTYPELVKHLLYSIDKSEDNILESFRRNARIITQSLNDKLKTLTKELNANIEDNIRITRDIERIENYKKTLNKGVGCLSMDLTY